MTTTQRDTRWDLDELREEYLVSLERLLEASQQLRDALTSSASGLMFVRERAEETFRERPYLVPVAAGAVGLLTGILLGSKITRFILFTAVGTLVSETFGGEIKRMSRELVSEMQHRLASGSEHDRGEVGEFGEEEA